MSALKPVMKVIGSHPISNQLFESESDKFGGLITDSQYAWFTNGADITLYSKQLGSIISSKSFAINQKDKSLKITFVKELSNCYETYNFILVGCSFKSSGILFICQLPTLTTIRCIELPNAISYISTINNKLAEDQLCDEFNVMSTVLLVGLATGAAYAIDLRQSHIEQQLKRNEIVVNESRPNKLFIVRKNEDCQEVKEMSDDSDSHLAMFINENFYAYCKKQYSGKLNLNVSSLLYIEEINTIAIGYSTGHYQLWDCKIMRTICLLKEPKCVMPVTHISFMEPSDDPNNLCYLWIIQSDNSKLPNATMIALTYEERTVMPNGHSLYRIYKGSGVKLEMSLKRETGIGRCISALSLSNVSLFRNETDIDEDCEIRLFAMLMEIRKNVDADPESYIFLFDINQWYKAQMPSNINHLQVSNSYASFVRLPYNVSCLDFNISDRTLRPFGYNFRSNVEELYYPSSIYFECDCLMNSEIIQFKHAGVQQEILDQLLLKNWKLLTNPSLVFSQCLQTNLRPFFWDNPEDYVNYSLLDQRSFIISILVENKILSVLSACAEEWKNGTYVSTGATILHLVQCLWKHVMVVKQFADKLCVPLFDYSGTQLDKKNKRILSHCLSQMECVKNFLKDLHSVYGVHIINVDYSFRVYTLNLVTQYFKAVTCFLNYGLLPESIEKDPTQRVLHCDFTSLIKYANKRRMELGDSQLYLIDAIIYNEPKGNKLIEQWQHEGGEATKGMYPPSTVQCLLRIYLNSALSDQVKDFITIYFLIDICSSQELSVMLANRMCNFAIEFDVENKGLNTLCRASWLFDHDMFEEAIEILSSNKEWMVDNDKSWDWFHWTVLKLLVFKTEYFWARFYMKLVNIKPENIDDHKFYINLQVLNNQYFDALNYIRSKSIKEKQILFEYFFDRCKETNKLKCLIEYLWELEEEELFYSYLKKFSDPDSLTIQLLFLLQRGRYIEAIELNKSLECINKSKCNDGLAITRLLVSGFDKSIPITMKQSYNHPPVKSLYKKTGIVTKCMNSDIKLFNVTDEKTENVVKLMNSPKSSSNSINLIIPPNSTTRKRSPSYDILSNEKRRKITDDYLLSPPKVVNDFIERPVEKHLLEILKTPLVEKTFTSPSVMNYSSILKTGSQKNHKRILSIRGDEIPASKTILRFSLPNDDNTSSIQQVDPEKNMDISKPDVDDTNDDMKNDDTINIESSDSDDFSNQMIKKSISVSLKDLPCDNSKKELLNSAPVDDECEQMDISEVYSSSDSKIESISTKESSAMSVCLDNKENEVYLLISSDEEEDKETSVYQSMAVNTNSNSSNLKCSYPVKNQQDIEEDDDVVISDSENEDEIEKEFSSACSSDSTETVKTLDSSSVANSSCDSDLENTRYGRFKSHKEEKIQDTNDQLEDEGEEEGEEEEESEEEEDEEEEGYEEEFEEGEDIENDEDSCDISYSGEENDQTEEINSEQYDVISSTRVNYNYQQSRHELINIDIDERPLDQEYNVDQPRLQNNKESDGTNSEHHLESFDDRIMYMLPNELEENLDVHECSTLNNLQPNSNENNETINPNDQYSAPSDNKPLLQNYIIQDSKTNKQTLLTNTNLLMKSDQLELTMDREGQILPMLPEEKVCETDHIAINYEENNKKDEKSTEQSLIVSHNTKDIKTTSNPQRSIRATSEQKELNMTIMNRSKRAKSLIHQSTTENLLICNSNNQLSELNNTFNSSSQEQSIITPTKYSKSNENLDSDGKRIKTPTEDEEEEGYEEEFKEGKKIENDEYLCGISYSGEENNHKEEINSEKDDAISSTRVNYNYHQSGHELINIDIDEEPLDHEYNVDQPRLRNNKENDGTNSEYHLESFDDRIMDILPNELEENLDVHECLTLNSLQPNSNENNETINPNDQYSAPSDNKPLLQNYIIQDSKTDKQTLLTNTNLLLKSDQLELTINLEDQILPMLPEEKVCETDHTAINYEENNKKDEKSTEQSLIVSHNTNDIKSTSKPQRSIRATSEQKELNMTIMTRSKRAKSLIHQSTTENLLICNSNNQLLELNNTFNNSSQEQSIITPTKYSKSNENLDSDRKRIKTPTEGEEEEGYEEEFEEGEDIENDEDSCDISYSGEENDQKEEINSEQYDVISSTRVNYNYQQSRHEPINIDIDEEPLDQEYNVDQPRLQNNKENDCTNSEHHLESFDDRIMDMLPNELEENLDVHECSTLNSLQPNSNENNETINPNDQYSAPSDNKPLLQNYIIQDSKTDKQTLLTNTNLLMKSDQLELTINLEDQILPMLPEEKVCETDHTAINYEENNKKDEKSTEQSLIVSHNTNDIKSTSKPQRSIRATSEQKELNMTIMTRSKRAKSLIHQSTTENLQICNSNNHLSELNNTFNSSSQEQSIITPTKYSKEILDSDGKRIKTTEPINLMQQINISETNNLINTESNESLSEIKPNENVMPKKSLSENDLTKKSFISLKQPSLSKITPRRSIRAKSEQSFEKIPIESINPYVALVPLSDTIITTKKIVEHKEIEQPLSDKTDIMEDIDDLNSSRRTSLRRSSVNRTRKCSAVCCDDSESKTKQTQSFEIEKNQLSVSISNINEKINSETNNSKKRRHPAKSSQLPETEIIKRRTRAKSETNLAGSLNLFRPSEMLKDNTRQVRVSLSRKKSKSQGNIVSTKQESGCSKSSIPVKPAFALELIPEEDTSNNSKNVESENVPTRKSKFNFLANKSNQTESNDTNVQLKTKAKTPNRRAKSMESGPARTLSTIKPKRPKRSASVNLLLSDEENEENDRMETYKKAIQIKQKRSTSEFIKSRKKPKISCQNKSILNISESEIESNESYQNVNELFTPAKKNTKIPMGVLNSENDDTSDDDSVVSKRIMTSKILQPSSSVELVPIDYVNRKNEHKSSVETDIISTTAVKEKKKPKADINKQCKTSISSISEIQNSAKKTVKSDTRKTDIDELPKRRRRNIKEKIQAPIDPSNDPLSERRMTRSQQLLLDKSLQSTSMIIHDETTNNLSTHKPEKKKTQKNQAKEV